MEKFNTTVPSFEFVHTLRGVFTGGVNPDTLWRFVLSVAGVLGLAIGVFAYLTYTWAGSSEAPVVPTQTNRETLSADELHAVIEVYRKKNTTYRSLMRTRPETPKLGIDAGVVIPKEVTTGLDESVLEVAPMGSPESVQ